MRTPGTFGHLLPIAVPGFIVMGALSVLVTPTIVGRLAFFSGSTSLLVIGVLTGTLVIGYLLSGWQTWLAGTSAGWALPPEAHLSEEERVVELPARAVQRAGFSTHDETVVVPLAEAFAMERALAGAWGTPEGAGWDRVSFVQRLVLAFAASAVLALGFLAGAIAMGAVSRGMRDHAGSVLVLGAIGAWLLHRLAARMRREAVLEILADARALLLDRGENTEVQRVLQDIGLRLQEEELGIGI